MLMIFLKWSNEWSILVGAVIIQMIREMMPVCLLQLFSRGPYNGPILIYYNLEAVFFRSSKEV